MMILGEKREKYLSELKLSTNVYKLTQNESIHPELNDCCRRLAYSSEPEDFSPKDIDVVPLWEGHSSITGFHISNGKPEFIKYYVESIDSFKVIGSSIQEVLTDLIENEVFEEIEDEDLNKIHELLDV
jgi:hypothetical protein